MTIFITCCISVILNVTLKVLPVNAISESQSINNLPEQSVSLSGGSAVFAINRSDYSKVKTIPGRNLSSGNNPVTDRFYWLDEFARNTPVKWERSIKMLADSLTKPARNKREKARLLFTWVATHVNYDTNAYKDDNYKENSPGATLRKKLGLCGDFSCLLCELCQAAGLEAYRISGLTKGFRFRMLKDVQPAHHAWNVIRIENRWTLTDVTWASSVSKIVGDSVISVPRFEPFWFDVDPKAFIFTHFPDSGKWQLLGKDLVSYQSFLSLPFLSSEFFKAKFNCNAVFQSAVLQKQTGFVKVFDQQHPVKVSKGPFTEYLARNKMVSFIVESDFAKSVALKEDSKWYFFRKANNVFSMDHVPTGKSVIITVLDKDCVTYKRLLEYETIPSD
jgi:hypothetical protein